MTHHRPPPTSRATANAPDRPWRGPCRLPPRARRHPAPGSQRVAADRPRRRADVRTPLTTAPTPSSTKMTRPSSSDVAPNNARCQDALHAIGSRHGDIWVLWAPRPVLRSPLGRAHRHERPSSCASTITVTTRVGGDCDVRRARATVVPPSGDCCPKKMPRSVRRTNRG